MRLVEPEYIFISAFASITLKNGLKKMDIEHCFEKPITKSELQMVMDSYILFKQA